MSHYQYMNLMEGKCHVAYTGLEQLIDHHLIEVQFLEDMLSNADISTV